MTNTPLNFERFVTSYRQRFLDGLYGISLPEVYRAVELIRGCRGMVWLAGNGGSASLASHMATDLQLAGVRAQALTDVSALSTYANDISYESSISEQIVRLVKWGDVVILISGSGNSLNIHRAAQIAKLQGAHVIGLTGFDGGQLRKSGLNCDLHCPVSEMGAAQDAQQMVLHWITYYLMELRKGDEQ